MHGSLLSFRLSEDVKAKFEVLSLAEGKSMSELARLLVTHVVTRHGDELPALEVNEADTSRARMELRVTGSELESIERIATQSGMSRNRWVVSLIRAYLAHKPQFGMDELAIIGESNKALAAIGRNLNQVAHALNKGQRTAGLGPDLESLRAQVESHIKSVSAAIQANVNRWRITWR